MKMTPPNKDRRPATGYREVVLNKRSHLAVLPVSLPRELAGLPPVLVIRIDSDTEVPQSASVAALDEV